MKLPIHLQYSSLPHSLLMLQNSTPLPYPDLPHFPSMLLSSTPTTILRPTVASPSENASVLPSSIVLRPTVFSTNAPEFYPATVPPPTVVSPPLSFEVAFSNVPSSMTARDLFHLFSIAGRVNYLDLPDHRGHGVCNFAYPSAAARAVDLFNGHDGMVVSLKY